MPLLDPARLAIRDGTPADLSFIVALRRRFSSELGFIPRDGIREHIELGHVITATIDGELAGYAIRGTFHSRLFTPHTRVFQLAVPDQLWRRTIGTALLDHLSLSAVLCASKTLRLHVRDGLPSQTFFTDIGFMPVEVRLGGLKRRKTVVVYEKLCP